MDQLSPVVQQSSILLSLHGQDLVGVALPFLIDAVSKDVPEDATIKLQFWRLSYDIDERLLVSLVVCFVAALYLTWDKFTVITPEGLLTYFGIVFTEAHLVYKLYFKNSWVRGRFQTKVLRVEEPPLG